MPDFQNNAVEAAVPAAHQNGNGHPLTCGQIAKELRRNVVSVFRAIKRLGIEAEITTAGGFKFYNVAVIDTLRAEMRAPNGSTGILPVGPTGVPPVDREPNATPA